MQSKSVLRTVLIVTLLLIVSDTDATVKDDAGLIQKYSEAIYKIFNETQWTVMNTAVIGSSLYELGSELANLAKLLEDGVVEPSYIKKVQQFFDLNTAYATGFPDGLLSFVNDFKRMLDETQKFKPILKKLTSLPAQNGTSLESKN